MHLPFSHGICEQDIHSATKPANKKSLPEDQGPCSYYAPEVNTTQFTYAFVNDVTSEFFVVVKHSNSRIGNLA